MCDAPMRTFVAVKNEDITILEPCLSGWCEYVDRYCAAWGDDVPYWYNERATLSTFAAAVAGSGGLVLEEYSESKKYEGKPYGGRVDLWFRPEGTERGFVSEAKHGWLKLPPCGPADLKRECKDRLDQAIRDVRDDKPHGEARLGLAFVVPLIRVGQDVRGLAIKLQRAAAEEAAADAVAWIFPELAKTPRHKEWVFPGVFLFVKLA